ncbi:MFS transporter [Pseudonocardia sp. KRD-184]|uniref:MFS transporter n=1 Tax=Pseudonocardia oceani TaxID=2792013 RepID=A0ABS6U9I5_9PSEU|nr:MFS transporter [Pseudonocardia oceani]MBW0100153.1 MFS transporter [Pseudonocardia oceani]MBW0112850.1 MFS transporter [Pseudonocardia oceani]MBW0121499.1 MFS transporter [Pseudonocardia oceani]MBW0128534.1 MFS transporter [Pseudonocardia oceani]
MVLAVGSAAQAATAAYFLGLAAVTPALRAHFDLDLAGVGLMIGAISIGLVPTLIPWGAAADRFGERGVMATGLVGSAAALSTAALVPHPLAAGGLLMLAGASGASVNAASGRAVMTWFPARSRGLAMAVRQTSVPVGAALAAVALPAVATAGGVPAVFLVLAAVCLVAAGTVAAFVREPPDAPPRGSRPAGRMLDVLTDRRLQRLSAAGLLLVVPQFLGSVFLVEVLHTGSGMPLAAAGALLALTQVLGAAGRLGNGFWSDRAGSRLRPLRIVAALVAVGFGGAALLQPGPVVLLAVVLVPAAALAISWNGLVFTAAGELAPPGRAATAMAVSNTANYMAAAATPVVGGLVAQAAGWPAMLALGTVAAALALLTLRGLREPGDADDVTPSVPRRTSGRRHGTVVTGH